MKKMLALTTLSILASSGPVSISDIDPTVLGRVGTSAEPRAARVVDPEVRAARRERRKARLRLRRLRGWR